ncbi:MAG: metal ABC transporter ATP-binding protein [Microthrixaceae bacterium]|nr:metal ABC transporter ATP-binding protein [Microthrixaceae bacterium]MCO5319676.1 metal ABC transporter ATP-binding protein [Microthrixaceae bacterium]
MTRNSEAGGGDPAVRARSVSVYRDSLRALGEVTFDLAAGCSMAVIGPNGSGKSTLLAAIAGLLEPRTGSLEVAARRRRGGVALVLQSTDIERSLPITVRETVQMARYPSLGLLRRCRPGDRKAVDSALDRVEMRDREWSQIQELSGGQRQRVMVAQGIAQQADLLLLDEPLTGLDVVSARTISEIMHAEKRTGRTVVFTTHDLGDAGTADVVLLLNTDQVAFGPPEDVLAAEPLREAFGGSVLQLDNGSVVLDDPHHAHSPQEQGHVHGR